MSITGSGFPSNVIQEQTILTKPAQAHYGETPDTIEAPNGIFDNLTVSSFDTDVINPATPGAGVTVDQLRIRYDSGATPPVESLTAVGAATNIGISLVPKGTGAINLGAMWSLQPITTVVTTVNAVTATLYTFATATGKRYDLTMESFGTTGTNICYYKVLATAKNIGGVLTILPGVSKYADRDVALVATDTFYSAVGTNIIVTVLGAAGQTINWTGQLQYSTNSV